MSRKVGLVDKALEHLMDTEHATGYDIKTKCYYSALIYSKLKNYKTYRIFKDKSL